MNKIFKAIIWQAFCLFYCVIAGKIWFGSWEVSAFSVFLCVSLIPAMWCYDALWAWRWKK